MGKKRLTKGKRRKKTKLIWIVLIIIIAWAIAMFVTNKTLKVKVAESNELTLKYSSLKYKEKSEDNNTILEGKDEKIVIKEAGKLSEYNNDYHLLVDYRNMIYKGENVKINGKQYLCYERKTGNCVELLTQIDDTYYLEIQVVPNKKTENVKEKIYSKEEVQDVINSIKIK